MKDLSVLTIVREALGIVAGVPPPAEGFAFDSEGAKKAWLTMHAAGKGGSNAEAPDTKDVTRVADILKRSGGDYGKARSLGAGMAKTITDPDKAVRRATAANLFGLQAKAAGDTEAHSAVSDIAKGFVQRAAELQSGKPKIPMGKPLFSPLSAAEKKAKETGKPLDMTKGPSLAEEASKGEDQFDRDVASVKKDAGRVQTDPDRIATHLGILEPKQIPALVTALKDDPKGAKAYLRIATSALGYAKKDAAKPSKDPVIGKILDRTNKSALKDWERIVSALSKVAK